MDALDDPVAKWVVMIFLLTSLVIGAVYVAKMFRDLAIGGGDLTSSAINDISDFEKSYAEGKISFEEYQKLKKTVPKYVVSDLGLANKPKSDDASHEKGDLDSTDFQEIPSEPDDQHSEKQDGN